MKKWIALLLIGVLAMTAFVGCAPRECESCGRTDVDTTKVEIGGETAYVCEYCEKVVNGIHAIGDAIDDLV